MDKWIGGLTLTPGPSPVRRERVATCGIYIDAGEVAGAGGGDIEAKPELRVRELRVEGGDAG